MFENIASCDTRRERRWGILELVVLHDFHDDGPMSYSSIATSSSHNNGMEGEVMDSRPTIAHVTYQKNIYIFITMAPHNLNLFSDIT